MNLPSSLFPSIDLTYIEDKYSGLSKQALFNAWSSLKGNKEASPLLPRYNETEVYSLFKLILICKNWLSAGCAFKQYKPDTICEWAQSLCCNGEPEHLKALAPLYYETVILNSNSLVLV